MSYNITSLTTDFTDDVLTVGGTGEPGMLATQIIIYAEDGETFITTQSTNVAEDGSFSLTFTDVAEGRYVVKAADYEGGDFYTVNTWTENEVTIEETENAATAAKPDTGRMTVEDTTSSTPSFLAPIIGTSVLVIVAAVVFVVLRKKHQAK